MYSVLYMIVHNAGRVRVCTYTYMSLTVVAETFGLKPDALHVLCGRISALADHRPRPRRTPAGLSSLHGITYCSARP